MIDHGDTSSTQSTSPTHREHEAKKKYLDRMQANEDQIRWTEKRKREKKNMKGMLGVHDKELQRMKNTNMLLNHMQ